MARATVQHCDLFDLDYVSACVPHFASERAACLARVFSFDREWGGKVRNERWILERNPLEAGPPLQSYGETMAFGEPAEYGVAAAVWLADIGPDNWQVVGSNSGA